MARDKDLRVIYHRGIKGDLFVWLYRKEFHIATIAVDASNAVQLILGLENRACSELRVRPLNRGTREA